MSEFGVFELLPAGLRRWFFARLNPTVLPRLRTNKTLKKFIDSEVFPYITENLADVDKSRDDYCLVTGEFHCTRCNSRVKTGGGMKPVPAGGIYSYSYGLKPDDYQPSGTANFSRIDNRTLNIFPEEHQPSGTRNESTLSSAFTTDVLGSTSRGTCYRCVFVMGLPPPKLTAKPKHSYKVTPWERSPDIYAGEDSDSGDDELYTLDLFG